MKILIPSDISGLYSGNPFNTDYLLSLERYMNVENGLFRLTQAKFNYDIVNIQWPEEIFGWSEPSSHQLAWLESQLLKISRNCKIVVTIHNHAPHYRDTEVFEYLYRLIYKYAHAFVHLGNASISILNDRYPIECIGKIHKVIPLGNYNSFGNILPRDFARLQLNLPLKLQMVLVVGALRNKEEYLLMADSYHLWSNSECGLLMAGKIQFKPAFHLRTLYERVCIETMLHINKYKFRKSNNFFNMPGPIHHDQMSTLVSAADVLLIPRKNILNSGNVPLGFTYGKVVVGPDVGVVGEILNDAGNPVFKPEGGAQDVADAVKKGLNLAAADLGLNNQQIAQTEWDWDKVARQYNKLYIELIA